MKTGKYVVERYGIEIMDCEDNTCTIKFEGVKGEAFSEERRKLYIIHDDKDILYVGEANCSIKVRFRRACTSYNHYARTGEARGGYKGYKWLNRALNKNRRMVVTIAIFNSDYDTDNRRSFIEAIEGELVYIVRDRLGYWPKFQNEIHFKNEIGAEEIALKIFDEISLHRHNR